MAFTCVIRVLSPDGRSIDVMLSTTPKVYYGATYDPEWSKPSVAVRIEGEFDWDDSLYTEAMNDRIAAAVAEDIDTLMNELRDAITQRAITYN